MKLRRAYRLDTAGIWYSADRRWCFASRNSLHERDCCHWRIGGRSRADDSWLVSVGLRAVTFKTRKAAISALELALGGN